MHCSMHKNEVFSFPEEIISYIFEYVIDRTVQYRGADNSYLFTKPLILEKEKKIYTEATTGKLSFTTSENINNFLIEWGSLSGDRNEAFYRFDTYLRMMSCSITGSFRFGIYSKKLMKTVKKKDDESQRRYMRMFFDGPNSKDGVLIGSSYNLKDSSFSPYSKSNSLAKDDFWYSYSFMDLHSQSGFLKQRAIGNNYEDIYSHASYESGVFEGHLTACCLSNKSHRGIIAVQGENSISALHMITFEKKDASRSNKLKHFFTKIGSQKGDYQTKVMLKALYNNTYFKRIGFITDNTFFAITKDQATKNRSWFIGAIENNKIRLYKQNVEGYEVYDCTVDPCNSYQAMLLLASLKNKLKYVAFVDFKRLGACFQYPRGLDVSLVKKLWFYNNQLCMLSKQKTINEQGDQAVARFITIIELGYYGSPIEIFDRMNKRIDILVSLIKNK